MKKILADTKNLNETQIKEYLDNNLLDRGIYRIIYPNKKYKDYYLYSFKDSILTYNTKEGIRHLKYFYVNDSTKIKFITYDSEGIEYSDDNPSFYYPFRKQKIEDRLPKLQQKIEHINSVFGIMRYLYKIGYRHIGQAIFTKDNIKGGVEEYYYLNGDQYLIFGYEFTKIGNYIQEFNFQLYLETDTPSDLYFHYDLNHSE